MYWHKVERYGRVEERIARASPHSLHSSATKTHATNDPPLHQTWPSRRMSSAFSILRLFSHVRILPASSFPTKGAKLRNSLRLPDRSIYEGLRGERYGGAHLLYKYSRDVMFQKDIFGNPCQCYGKVWSSGQCSPTYFTAIADRGSEEIGCIEAWHNPLFSRTDIWGSIWPGWGSSGPPFRYLRNQNAPIIQTDYKPRLRTRTRRYLQGATRLRFGEFVSRTWVIDSTMITKPLIPLLLQSWRYSRGLSVTEWHVTVY